jgi:hypothetical protein
MGDGNSKFEIAALLLPIIISNFKFPVSNSPNQHFFSVKI